MAFSFRLPWDNQNNPGQNQEALRPNTQGWDDFWAGIGGMIGDAGNNMGNGFNDWASGKMGRDKLDAYHNSDAYKANVAERDRQAGGRGPLPGPSQSMQLINSLGSMPGINTSGGPTRQGHDETLTTAPLSEDALRMAELKAKLNEDFKPSGEYNSMIEQAYAGALSNIGKARGDANANFEKSDAAINDMTQGHVHEIKTNDRSAIAQNANRLTGEYSDIYSQGRQQLQGDQAAEMKTKAEALSRLGLAEAGMGDAGKTQSEAIQRMTQDETGAKAQASGYKAADLARNTEQAQSQASAGVERRSALHNQLQKILGNIDESQATVNNSMAMAKLQGAQNEKSDFRQQQQFNLDSLTQLEDRIQGKADKDRDYSLELQKLNAKNGGSGGVFDAVGSDLQSRNMDPAPYLDALSQVSQTPYNQVTDGDKTLWMVRKMKEKNPGLNDSEILRYVMGVNNYGTDKLNN